MKKVLFALNLFLLIATAFTADIYFGADYVFPASKETRGLKNPLYSFNEEYHPLADLKSRWSDTRRTYRSATPDYSAYSLNLRGGFYLSERNRVGLEFLYTLAESDAGFLPHDTLTASSARRLNYTTFTAHFAQELWSGLYVDGKAGWCWRYYKWDNRMVANDSIVEIDAGANQITGPAFGVGIGWNQRLFSQLSAVFHINWIYHIYIDDYIVRARIFTLNAGLNWGIHYHSTVHGKN